MDTALVVMAQLAYFFMLLGLLSPNLESLRKFFVAGSTVAVVYAFTAEKDPLWVPLTWHGLFLLFNGYHVVQMAQKKRRESLDPVEEFLKKTVFSTFPSEDLKSFVKFGMEGTAPSGQSLAKAGDPAREIVCIIQGNAAVQTDGTKFADLSSGRLFGTGVLGGDTEIYYDVVAVTEVKAIVWTMEAIDTWAGKNVKRVAMVQAAAGAQHFELMQAEAEFRRKLGMQAQPRNEGAEQHNTREIA
jgi:hypothetical protein